MEQKMEKEEEEEEEGVSRRGKICEIEGRNEWEELEKETRIQKMDGRGE